MLIATRMWWRDEDFKPYLRHLRYRKDRGFDFKGANIELTTHAVRLIRPCVACGRDIAPIRFREGAASGEPLYFSQTCPLSVRIGCSHGQAASDAQDDLIKLLGGQGPDPAQGTML